MELNVSLYQDHVKLVLGREVVTGPDDAEKIGQMVGRRVRDWLRCRPIANSGTRARFDVHAWWTNGAPAAQLAEVPATPKPKRKRRGSKS